MNDLRLALRALLLGDATVSALVGGVRVHPIRLPQGQQNPSIVLNRVTESGHYVMSGSAGMAQARFQVDSWALTSQLANELGNAAYDALSGYRGPVSFGGNSPQDSFVIHGVFLDQGREDFDATSDLYRLSRDYIVYYVEG